MFLILLFSFYLYAKEPCEGDNLKDLLEIKKHTKEIGEIYKNSDMLWKRLTIEEKQEIKKQLPTHPEKVIWLK